MNENRKSMTADWVDEDDAPELTEHFFECADEFNGEKLVKRGRPKESTTKQALSLRLDQDVIDAFRATGKGWQTKMNSALKEWIKQKNMTVAKH